MPTTQDFINEALSADFGFADTSGDVDRFRTQNQGLIDTITKAQNAAQNPQQRTFKIPFADKLPFGIGEKVGGQIPVSAISSALAAISAISGATSGDKKRRRRAPGKLRDFLDRQQKSRDEADRKRRQQFSDVLQTAGTVGGIRGRELTAAQNAAREKNLATRTKIATAGAAEARNVAGQPKPPTTADKQYEKHVVDFAAGQSLAELVDRGALTTGQMTSEQRRQYEVYSGRQVLSNEEGAAQREADAREWVDGLFADRLKEQSNDPNTTNEDRIALREEMDAMFDWRMGRGPGDLAQVSPFAGAGERAAQDHGAFSFPTGQVGQTGFERLAEGTNTEFNKFLKSFPIQDDFGLFNLVDQSLGKPTKDFFEKRTIK